MGIFGIFLPNKIRVFFLRIFSSMFERMFSERYVFLSFFGFLKFGFCWIVLELKKIYLKKLGIFLIILGKINGKIKEILIQ